MSPVCLKARGTGTGMDGLPGKEAAEGVTGRFEGKQPVFVCGRSLEQRLCFRAAQRGKADSRPVVA
jgi:hypothetical protein